jgi:hypothetical protein
MLSEPASMSRPRFSTFKPGIGGFFARRRRTAAGGSTLCLAAGLIAPATRAIRELFAGSEQPPGRLSEADRLQAQAHRQQAGRKLKMARLLAAGGLLEEEREALLHSASWLARAPAVENHLQEPAELGESLRAPGSIFWGPAAAVLMKCSADASAPSGPVTEAIQNLLGGIPS